MPLCNSPKDNHGYKLIWFFKGMGGVIDIIIKGIYLSDFKFFNPVYQIQRCKHQVKPMITKRRVQMKKTQSPEKG